MSFCGHCRVWWQSPKDIQTKAVSFRAMFSGLQLWYFKQAGRVVLEEGAKSLSSFVPVSHKAIMAPCAGCWVQCVPLLTRPTSVTPFHRLVNWGLGSTHYSNMTRQDLNPGLSNIKSFPCSGKEASMWIFHLLRACLDKHICTCRKWTGSNVPF